MPEFDQSSMLSDDQFCEEDSPFGVDADSAILRLAALDLMNSLRRNGIPQNATRPVVTFARSWNTASADSPLPTDGKYTQTIQAALDAALRALSPGSGGAPQAIL
jgi:hypothetical protein